MAVNIEQQSNSFTFQSTMMVMRMVRMRVLTEDGEDGEDGDDCEDGEGGEDSGDDKHDYLLTEDGARCPASCSHSPTLF